MALSIPWELSAIKGVVYFAAFAFFGFAVARRHPVAVLAWSAFGAILRVMAGYCSAIVAVVIPATFNLSCGFVYPILVAMRFLLWWSFTACFFEPPRQRPVLIFASVMTAVNILIDILAYGLPRVAGLLTK